MLGDRHIAVCRELTKVYEEVFRGTISQAIAHFETPRGEFTLVVEGVAPSVPEPDRIGAAGELERLRRDRVKAREAVSRVSREWGLSHRETYRLWLELPRDESPRSRS